MEKKSELSANIAELHNCGDKLSQASNTLSELIKCGERITVVAESINSILGLCEPEEPVKKKLEYLDMRHALATKSRAGYTNEIKELIRKHGVELLSEVDPVHYQTLLAEVEAL